MNEESKPRLVRIKGGWAALGKDWAVFGASEEEAIQHFRDAAHLHAEIDARIENCEGSCQLPDSVSR